MNELLESKYYKEIGISSLGLVCVLLSLTIGTVVPLIICGVCILLNYWYSNKQLTKTVLLNTTTFIVLMFFATPFTLILLILIHILFLLTVLLKLNSLY